MSSSLVNSWMVEKHGNRSGTVLEDDGDDPGLYRDHEAENLEIAMPSKFTEADRARIASEGPKKYSRDEHRKLKALEEARKMGTAPAEVDEDGYEINPHIPHYVKNVPWYFDKDKKPSLRHQRNKNERWTDGMNNWYARGVETVQEGKQKKRWAKDSCQNCGATNHKVANCLERPRKIGAKFNNKNLAKDDYIQPDLDLGFEGKRDRWNGYDPEMHAQIYDKYRKVELAKKALKLEHLEKRLKEGEVMSTEQMEDELMHDDDKYTDHDQDHALNIVPKEGKRQPQSDTQARHVVRNLRIREDTAKYLRNLEVNSAYYDPKTRSMRDNPTPGKDTDYRGDNFIRQTGEAADIVHQQTFVWEANRKGVDLHLYADPTRVFLMKDQVRQRKQDIREKHKSAVLDVYGGEEHLKKPEDELMFGQTVNYKEFTREGRVKNATQEEEANKPKQVTASRYEENVFVNNHITVWGSYWRDFRWGYACCHSFIKSSYCLGEGGKETTAKADIEKLEHYEKVQEQKRKEEAFTSSESEGSDSDGSSSSSSGSSSSSSGSSSSSSSSSNTSSSGSDDGEPGSKNKRRRRKKKTDAKKKKSKKTGKNEDGEDDGPQFESKEEMDKLQLSAAPLGAFRRAAGDAPEMDDRRRGYFSGRGGAKEKSSMPTDAEMEKYRHTKLKSSDPMSSYLNAERARKEAEERARAGH